MNASKLLISSVAALSVVGAISLANAQQGNQMTNPPAATQADPNQQMNNNNQNATGTTTPTPGGTMNNNTMNNAPTANDPALPAQADRN